jgi:hypothetical protein
MPDPFDLDFTSVTKPTLEQVRFVWFSKPKPSCRSVADELQKRGAKISFKTVARYHAMDWIHGARPRRRSTAEQTRAAGSALIGTQLSEPELNKIEEEIALLAGMSIGDLVDAQEKARLIYNTMLLRCATRKADMLAIVPRDAAALMIGATEAVQATAPPIVPTEPDHHTNGVGNGRMIDVTPMNPISAAIADFQRKRTAA